MEGHVPYMDPMGFDCNGKSRCNYHYEEYNLELVSAVFLPNLTYHMN